LSTELRVIGAEEVSEAFLALGLEVRKAIGPALAAAADPIASDAAQRAMSNIRNMTSRWSRMKTGIKPSLVYVAPAARRAGGSPRPNLANLLANRALDPALDEHSAEVVAAVDVIVSEAARSVGF